MPPNIVVLIREDPHKTHRAVEALRIALGLAAGENPLTVVLLGEARALLTADPEDLVDGDILEKYLPSLKQLEIPFLVATGACRDIDCDPAFHVSESSPEEIRRVIATADRVVAF